MGNELEFLFMMKDNMERDGVTINVVTDTDAEVFIDDYIFRVNVVSDVNG